MTWKEVGRRKDLTGDDRKKKRRSALDGPATSRRGKPTRWFVFKKETIGTYKENLTKGGVDLKEEGFPATDWEEASTHREKKARCRGKE